MASNPGSYTSMSTAVVIFVGGFNLPILSWSTGRNFERGLLRFSQQMLEPHPLDCWCRRGIGLGPAACTSAARATVLHMFSNTIHDFGDTRISYTSTVTSSSLYAGTTRGSRTAVPRPGVLESEGRQYTKNIRSAQKAMNRCEKCRLAISGVPTQSTDRSSGVQ